MLKMCYGERTMSDFERVRKYFQEEIPAEGFPLAAGEPPARYPAPSREIRLALEAVARRKSLQGARLLDLGCGSGELCYHAVSLGLTATGLDTDELTLSAAREYFAAAPLELRERAVFLLGDPLHTRLDRGSFDVVTALHLIETYPADRPLFAEADRVLKPGGVLAVSCRNRLFNMSALNELTAQDIATGAAPKLLAQIGRLAQPLLDARNLLELVERLERAIPKMKAAAERDLAEQEKKKPIPKFATGRRPRERQHTPEELADSAWREGFVEPAFFGAHPFVLPPGAAVSAPRFSAQLAWAFEALNASSASLAWCLDFVGLFTKPA